MACEVAEYCRRGTEVRDLLRVDQPPDLGGVRSTQADVPRARRGTVMTYFLGCFNLGFALWVMLMGVVAKSHGYPIVFLLTGLLVWSSLLVLPQRARGLVA